MELVSALSQSKSDRLTDSPLIKAGSVRIDPDTHAHLDDYLCHFCERLEVKPKRFEGGCWTGLPFGLPEAEEAFGVALGKIMDRKP